MPRGSSAKRERQYEHIKESGEERGMSEGRAKEMAARTVNKERARSGESKTASRSSTQGKSASQRGGERSGGGGSSSERTKDELYQEAKKRNIEGRSTMTKQQLKNALGH
ncbi:MULTISPECIES: plasmid stabilization protein [unclassified Streptomyces]|uniref:plasmid stabilization protein n=1 Tax=unclassified Streptomyces TaxID=2593676 RepID=UPI0006B220B1|nr:MULTISPECIES: plasmid stabilization protein [unclassified Streptomyces]KOY55115.1 plasmid stabilization protein [Streptomyces sp. XY332]THA31849.1 plasmid stabilization protein [Streptomyces sp. A1547]